MSNTLTFPTPAPALNDHEVVSEAVVTAVADEIGVEPLDLEPLMTVIEPDALETLIDSMDSSPDEPMDRVSFTYSGCEVTVTGDGAVSVTELEPEL